MLLLVSMVSMTESTWQSSNTTYGLTGISGIIPNITDRNQWPEVDKAFKLYHPAQKKKESGRLRKNRIKSARETGGKATRQVMCPNCKEYGHRGGSWKCSLTGTKKS